MKKLLLLIGLLLGTVAISAQEMPLLKIITYDSFYISDAVIEQFEAEHNVTVEILRLADAGVLVNQSILTVGNPLGDVLYGVDNTFLSRALENDLFIPYESPMLADVPEEFQLDLGEFRVTPVQYGDVCLNYDASQFTAETAPQTLADLTDPRYKGMLVVQNPASSSPGLAFLLATIAVFGEEGDYTYLDFWSDLVTNDVLAVAGWSEAYYGEFSIAGGSRPLVVSYATSPLAEVFYNELDPENPPTGAVIADETCFRQVEFMGILNGTQNEALAQQFIDFALSPTFQEDIPLNMWVLPVNSTATLPDLYVEYATIPENPLTLDYARIEEMRDAWLQAWAETVLR
ncbi:MAG: thiamine ABC transporter substrate-binding protein [Phototrophicales bacterium]|nr:MAG: thiamine ABC transporter substrate-binding protein [Phototrophicales bacterium]